MLREQLFYTAQRIWTANISRRNRGQFSDGLAFANRCAIVFHLNEKLIEGQISACGRSRVIFGDGDRLLRECNSCIC